MRFRAHTFVSPTSNELPRFALSHLCCDLFFGRFAKKIKSSSALTFGELLLRGGHGLAHRPSVFVGTLLWGHLLVVDSSGFPQLFAYSLLTSAAKASASQGNGGSESPTFRDLRMLRHPNIQSPIPTCSRELSALSPLSLRGLQTLDRIGGFANAFASLRAFISVGSGKSEGRRVGEGREGAKTKSKSLFPVTIIQK